MTMENTRERFQNAVGILVDEKGGVKDRLMVAYVSQLIHVNPSGELPEHLVAEFNDLKFKLTTDEVVGDRGTVSKELKKISEDEASRIARQIFDMFLEVYDLKETSHET